MQRGQNGKSRKNEGIRPDVCLDRVIPPACPVYREKVAGSRNINLVISQDQKLVILICSSVHLSQEGMTQRDFDNFSSKRWNLACGKMWWLIKSLGSSKWFSWYLACSRFWGDNQILTGATFQAVKNKEIDMKGAAELLGVSYGTLYGRYR